MATYDKYYKQKNYFKGACPELIDFFMTYPQRGSLCDLGAGQGRDSIPLSKLGYSVTAVDISQVGLSQIKQTDKNINTIVCDIYNYDISEYDFILMDSMLHFYKNDLKKESELVTNILKDMKAGSVFANNMIKSKYAEEVLCSILNEYGENILVAEKKHIAYPDFNSTYFFTVVKKLF